MIRFALVVASVLGFVLTAALGNMMVPLQLPQQRHHQIPERRREEEPQR